MLRRVVVSGRTLGLLRSCLGSGTLLWRLREGSPWDFSACDCAGAGLISCSGLAFHEILVRNAFSIKGACGEGVIEQIDGIVEIDGYLYLVEMKWWNSPIGTGEVSPHLVRVFSRGGQVRGLFISYTDFTEAAIAQCRDAIVQGRVVILSTLEEIVSLLNQEGDMKAWLKAKLEAAIVDKQPFVRRLN